MSGRLNFEYDNPLSRLREQFILNELENEMLVDAYKLKTLVLASAIPVNPKENIATTNKLLTACLELLLPYVFKEGKLKGNNSSDLGVVSPEKLAEWNAIIDSYNKKEKNAPTTK